MHPAMARLMNRSETIQDIRLRCTPSMLLRLVSFTLQTYIGCELATVAKKAATAPCRVKCQLQLHTHKHTQSHPLCCESKHVVLTCFRATWSYVMACTQRMKICG